MLKFFISAFLIIFFFSGNSAIEKNENLEIKINWQENVSGDFSFTKNWDYPEGVYRNDFGQLSCDGFCPPETDRMKDENGRIFKDSLARFYQLVDTTHLFHSIKSKTNSYEWSGTNFITVKKIGRDTLYCSTDNNAATHSSLILKIIKNKCIPEIELNSISGSAKKQIYVCKKGDIKIDKILWNNGILKAKFDLIFEHPENPNKPLFWKGKILTQINQNRK
ncbi:hypothetical protein [Flavobacterium nitrogenifigens]|uniref:Uncharacterized protein n=1 Tax=Flavobacterium nitrogenifigens TaxID=1617283 RepID=A0A521BIS4_9FLAO|nr:hypothetical protein [Flavobacterium nitrogenifigens]KAF2330936.1 hypothetical protein DM397_14205 [Flavobacterium nitrogenifigens]SMO47057.1 hypothetical protein SAMN06265220_1011042 [Flavobacterium nitrogenifigens]